MAYYSDVEDNIVARLAPLAGRGFVVQEFPDTEAARRRQSGKATITVAYNNSYYGDSNSPGRPALMTLGAMSGQEEFAEFMVTFVAARLRTQRGIYEAMDLAERLLLGWEPGSKSKKITFIKKQFVEHEDGRYVFALTLLTSRLVVEAKSETGQPGGLTPGDAPAEPPLFKEGETRITC